MIASKLKKKSPGLATGAGQMPSELSDQLEFRPRGNYNPGPSELQTAGARGENNNQNQTLDVFIQDETPDHKYFTILPNLVDDLPLSVYSLRLYVHLKRVTGENGKCWQSTRTLAKRCHMSTSQVVRSKHELEDHDLIQVFAEHDTKRGGKDYHVVTISDIWARNVALYSQNKNDHVISEDDEQVPTRHLQVPTRHKQVPVVERINNPLKKRAKKEKRAPPSGPPSPSPKCGDGAVNTMPSAGSDGNSSKNHPAIQAIKELTGYYPPKKLCQPIIKLLGDAPDIPKLQRVFTAWIAKGYNPRNYEAWLFEKYPNGDYYSNPQE
jgi:hypothetical protein